MFKKSLFILFFILNNFCVAQGVNNLWLMGYGSGAGFPYGNMNLDFFTGTANIYYYARPMNFFETNGEICDSSGNLKFYTNGVFILNSFNDTMQNGIGLNPSAYTTMWSSIGFGLKIGQGNLIIPFINDTTKYYLFHETGYKLSNTNTYQPLEIYYSVIDMTLDSGRGGIINKNTILLTDTLMLGEVTGVKHGDGRDWWLIFHRYNSDLFYKYLITPYGINGPFTQNIGSFLSYGGGRWLFHQTEQNMHAIILMKIWTLWILTDAAECSVILFILLLMTVVPEGV